MPFNSFNSRLLCSAVCLAALSLCGCWRQKEKTEAADLPVYTPPEVAVEKSVIVSPTGMAWDGQFSGWNSEAPLAQCLSEGLRALGDLGFSLDTKKSQRSTTGARLNGLNQEKLPAEIYLKALPENKTEIKVKVGLLGDRSGSERLLTEIRRGLVKLKMGAPGPGPGPAAK